MAKKKYKETVASVVAVAVGAYLLGKAKRNQATTGIGSIKSSILITGDFQIVKDIAHRVELLTDYIDKQEESGSSDGLWKTVAFTYPSYKAANEAMRKIYNDIRHQRYILHTYNRDNTEFSVRSIYNEEKRASISVVKGGVNLF